MRMKIAFVTKHAVFSFWLALICAPAWGQDADGQYDGDSGNWSNGGMWLGGIIANGVDKTAVFRGPASKNVNVSQDSTRTIGNLTNNHTSDNYTFTVTPVDGSITLTLATTAPAVPTLTGTRGASLTIKTPLLGSQGLVKTGAKPVILDSTESIYSGDTVVAQGALRLAVDSTGLPVSKGPLGVSRLVLKSGGTLQSSGTSNRTIGNEVVIDEDLYFDGGQNYYGGLILNGPITMTGDRALNSVNVSLYFYGICADGGNNYKLTARMGSKYLYTANQHTYGGGTVLNGGGILIGANSTGDPVTSGPLGTGPLSILSGILGHTGANGSTWRFSNPVSIDGNMQFGYNSGYATLHLDGPVTLTGDRIVTVTTYSTGYPVYLNAGISDGGNGYSMRVRATAGYLGFGGTNTIGGGIYLWEGTTSAEAGSVWNAPSVTLLDSSVILRVYNGVGKNTELPPLVFDNSNPTLWVRGVASGGVMSLDGVAREGRGVLTLAGGTSATSALTANDKLLVVNDAPSVVNGMIAPSFREATGDFLTYDETLGLKRATYTTGDINAAGATAVYSATSAQTLTGDREVYALRAGSMGGIGGAYDLTVGSGGVSATAAQSLDCNLQFDDQEGSIWNSATVTMNGLIKGSNGITKSGGGILVLANGANGYTGPTTLNAGTLRLGAADALPSQPLAINGGTALLEMNGQSATVGNLTLKGGEIRNDSTSPATLTIGTEVVYDGVNRGAWIWSGYSTTVRPLNLTLSGPTTFTVANGYAGYDLLIGSTSNNRFVPIGGTDSPVTKLGPGFMFIAGNNSFTGDVTVEDGILHGHITGVGHQPFGNAANDLKLKRNGILSLSGGAATSTTAGDLEFAGANALRYDGGTSSTALTLASLSRVGRGTLILLGTVSGGDYNDWWGGNGSLYIDAWKSATPPNVNGMLPAYLMGAGYTGDNGLGSFAWVALNTGKLGRLSPYDGNSYLGLFRRGTIASAAADETVDMTAAASLSDDDEVWALRTTKDLEAGVSPAPTLTLGSGGLIVNAEASVGPKLRFGSSGDAEAIVFVAGGYGGSVVRTATLAGSLTTSAGLTKAGGGTLALTADSSATLSGSHWVNEGTLRLAHASALAAGAEVNIERGATVEIADNYTLDYVFNGLGSIKTGDKLLTATGVLSPGFSVGTLTVEDLLLKGSYVWEYDGTNSDAIACTTLAFGSGAEVDCQWLGAGDAAMGSYTLFTYNGTDPNVSAVTVAAPPGLQGELSVDSANKRVLLDLGEFVPRGTLILLR